MSSQIIKWPNEQEQNEIMAGFEAIGFPGVLGAMDGVHFQIDKPTEDPISYLNRKKFYSIHVSSLFISCTL